MSPRPIAIRNRIIIAHHLVLMGYGHWLPNDIRGSGSDEIRKELLAALGEIHHGRKQHQPDRVKLKDFHARAKPLLEQELLWFDVRMRQTIAESFAHRPAIRISHLGMRHPEKPRPPRGAAPQTPPRRDLAHLRGGVTSVASRRRGSIRSPSRLGRTPLLQVSLHSRRRPRPDRVCERKSREGEFACSGLGVRGAVPGRFLERIYAATDRESKKSHPRNRRVTRIDRITGILLTVPGRLLSTSDTPRMTDDARVYLCH